MRNGQKIISTTKLQSHVMLMTLASARCNMKNYEKNKTRKKCDGASQKKVQFQKSAIRKNMQYEKSATRKKVQQEKSKTCKKCNMEKV